MGGVAQAKHSDRWITVQCDGVSQRSLGAWSRSGKSRDAIHYVQLMCNGIYADKLFGPDDPIVPANGMVTLEPHFVEDAKGKHAGLMTDLAEDGSHLEISVASPVSMLDWTERLLADASADKPIIMSGSRDAEGRLTMLTLRRSARRLEGIGVEEVTV